MHVGYKRMILFLLAFVLAFSLAGCGSTEDASSSNTDKKIEKSEKKESAKQEKKADAEEEDAKATEEKAATEASGEQAQTTTEASGAADNQATNSQTNNQSVSSTQATTSTKTQSIQSTQPQQQATQPVAPAQTQPSNPAPQHAVTISVIGPADHRNILGTTKINIKEGDTVYDILLKTGLQVDARNDYGSKYVEGIENIYEGDYPGQSGWTYKLNGVLLPVSAGKAAVKDGDKIVWEYVGG